MKNKLVDLNNHLFAQLERLSDEGIKLDDLEKEIARTEAVVRVSDQIIRNADTHIKTAKLIADHGASIIPNLPLISHQSMAVKAPLIKAAGDE